MRGVNDLPNLSYEGIEKMMHRSNFTDIELDLISINVLASKEISIPSTIRKVIHHVTKSIINLRSLNKFQESFATKDTAKFCKAFYKNPVCKFAIFFQQIIYSAFELLASPLNIKFKNFIF